MRTASIFAGLLLIALAVAQPVAAEPAQNTGPYAGTVRENEVDHHRFSTHGDNPCVDIWVPKLYVVTLTHAPTTDALQLGAGSEVADSQNGVATVSFVANYCTSFDIYVAGVAVSGVAAYGVTVESVFLGPGAGIDPPM